MKALVTSTVGSINTAIVTSIDVPEPGPHEIRIKVHSVGLNPVDALYVAHPVDKPGRVVGSDIAGTVDKVGVGISKFSVGDRVTTFLQGATSSNYRPGGFAEYAVAEEDLTIRIPSTVSFEEAATLPLCALTAAQIFTRLGINLPFPSPFHTADSTGISGKHTDDKLKPPAILIYSAATSVGLLCVELAQLLRTPTGDCYRIYATASPKHHEKLKTLGVDGVFDYRSPKWDEDVFRTSGGISYAVDCISEGGTTARITNIYIPGSGRIAVVRKTAWSKENVRKDIEAFYGTAWEGLGHEIVYDNTVIPVSPSWTAFAISFFKFLSDGDPGDPSRFPIAPLPYRLMPGGLEGVVRDGFRLLGPGTMEDRLQDGDDSKPWLRPISGEKLVYHIDA
ncbi:hypothetical protein AX16_002106 [Volvariella volvacea WC 439]|nr:hypothetical protein AX16_002106 [Volvariella volvacea WC 439]